MTPIPNEEITDSILRMRTSLARIELAASRLARDAMTPAARQSAAGISEAVLEIDDEISEAIRALQPRAETHADIGDCTPILATLHERIAPVLESYAIDWPASKEDDAPFIGDRVAIELAALVMLRTGIALAGVEGTIRLVLVHDSEPPCIGLRLTTDRRDDAPTAPDSLLDRLAPVRALSHRSQGSLDVCHTEGTPIVTFWMAPTEAGK